MSLRTCHTVLVLLISILSLAGCSSNRIYLTESRWADREIAIDGKADKWQGTQAFLEEERLFVSFLNDRDYLYIGLVASEDPTGDQIMRQGLTVWLDPMGGKNKTFGIRYPLETQFSSPPEGLGENRPEDRGDRGDNEPIEKAEMPPRGAGQELEIVRPEKGEPEKIGIAQAKYQGLEINVTTSGELFVYELRIPLLATQAHPLAVGVQPGSKIGIGFETIGKGLKRPAEGSGPSGGTSGGGGVAGRPGMGGMAGRPGGGGGGIQDFDRDPDISKPLKCWLIVHLANK